ncbi:PQQ-dependent sugar dehydrogenase [Novosphingobium sp. KCTC 2891]|uniref:PQQ-dependent sugar dehydrogenase n=1 Tax=Novosphingobium sp. KCTC 2891 TaxID=2989730 RepID=UPI002222ED85|nr:PQQ-dependent sugar dehydrogenase [Novosphingobium sp. KCTC 2891]MCW1384256.1 PQQ-dependent sugar dehydrogenase [Novosphingobium sp. KCTC 2891]
MKKYPILTALSPLVLILASCGAPTAAQNAPEAASVSLKIEDKAVFREPWAMAFLPGTPYALVTEKAGGLKLWQDGSPARDVAGVPKVDYGGQGGLGDVKPAPDFAQSGTIYLTWVESGPADTRGAVLGRGRLVLDAAPRIEGLSVIWRQAPKVTGRGHFSHRIAFSPDGKYLFLSSGERQKFTPAQDLTVNLGKVLRLLPDGTPAPGNPFADKGGVSAQIWSYGHRNLLGLKFDPQGRLWDLEHGPAGGDELNLVEPGRNYGWPLVSDGDHYDGKPIPRHKTRPDLAAPAISWNPVIAPGDFIFYTGDRFPAWKGQAIIAGMGSMGLVRVAIDGTKAREVERIGLDNRVREIEQGPDGAIWILEDSEEGRLRKLTPR